VINGALLIFNDANNRSTSFDAALHIDTLYDALINILRVGDQAFVPRAKIFFYKFWWTEELDLLKQNSMDSSKLWKEAGKSRSRPIFYKATIIQIIVS